MKSLDMYHQVNDGIVGVIVAQKEGRYISLFLAKNKYHRNPNLICIHLGIIVI